MEDLQTGLDIYTFVMNALVVLLIAIFIRHSLYRLRYFLHMSQQLGYKTNEYGIWIFDHFFSKTIIIEQLLFFSITSIIIYFFTDQITLTSGIILLITFAAFWFIGVSSFKPEKEKKPLVYTSRLQRLGWTSLLLMGFMWFMIIDFAYSGIMLTDFAAPFINTDPYFLAVGLVVVDMSVPFFLYLAMWLMKPIEKNIQNGFKRQARKKLASLPHLKVIAITGSYGKTSTKFAIHAFLKERLQVCVTPGSYNTPMGICKVINNDLEAHHQVLILEMGARYSGNIKELCEIARPDISVITNVGISHLETFGSQDAVAEEKSTLAKELKPGGTLILNGDDDRVRKMAELRDDVKIVFTGKGGDVEAKDIEVNADGTSFKLSLNNGGGTSETQISTRLLGAHNIQNMLLAAAVATEFDIRDNTIAVAAKTMAPVEHRLELKSRNGLIVIDDAFNSNPVGAKNAVDILASFTSGKRILITPGMIELGELEDVENRKFGEHIARAELDLVILVGEKQTEPIALGINSITNQDTKVEIVSSLFEANKLLTEFASPGDIVLYENDLPDTYNS